MKVIKPSVATPETRLRFAQEVEIPETVWGARIAALLDADAEAEPPWPATEYVEPPRPRRTSRGHRRVSASADDDAAPPSSGPSRARRRRAVQPGTGPQRSRLAPRCGGRLPASRAAYTSSGRRCTANRSSAARKARIT